MQLHRNDYSDDVRTNSGPQELLVHRENSLLRAAAGYQGSRAVRGKSIERSRDRNDNCAIRRMYWITLEFIRAFFTFSLRLECDENTNHRFLLPRLRRVVRVGWEKALQANLHREVHERTLQQPGQVRVRCRLHGQHVR